MVYFEDAGLLIRYMEPGDVRTIVREETAQGDAVSVEKYDMRLRDQAENRSVALVAVYHGAVAGYIHVYREAGQGPLPVRASRRSWISACWKNTAKTGSAPALWTWRSSSPGHTARPSAWVSACTAGTAAHSGYMPNGGIFRTVRGYGTGTPSASLTPFAAMTTI